MTPGSSAKRLFSKWKWEAGFLCALAFWGYLGFLIVLPLLFMIFAESHWILVLLRFAPPLSYLAGLALVSIAARIFKVRYFWQGAAAGLIIVLTYYMGFQLHLSRVPAGGTLSVMSFNIHAGTGGEEAIGSFLAGSRCDIIGLQEARKPLLVNLPDPVPKIAAMLPGYSLARGGSRGELATLSRYPIVSFEEHPLDDLCMCTEAVIDIRGRKLRFLNVHVITGDPKGILKGADIRQRLVLTARTRSVQAEALHTLISTGILPVVIAGDFNSPPDSGLHRIMRSNLKDSFSEAGNGFGYTYRANLPLWRIDYVWASGLNTTRCRTLNPGLSDHKAVEVLFDF
ncbi:MAG: endonuclease/exonuclease/phosphatase family protein [Candidatus Eremiobacteraeota bacterium]|nr:endonuclease/exonuclease/phosphatase family protein [Candidatus Eremiobacteraeota bacterium]